jgi:transcription initiation factor TFIID subunit 6
VALSGQDNSSVKPLVKHILSSEIQLYFERITTAILEDRHEETRNAAFNSVRTDPGLHQLVPYFIQFIADKITHHSRELFTLTQMLNLAHALLQNQSLFIEPYIGALVPTVLTCLVGKHLGSQSDPVPAVFALRDLAASLVIEVARKHSKQSTTLKPRLARTLLKAFLDPNRSLGAHYGAIMGLQGLVGSEGLRLLILPNLKEYDAVLREGLADEAKRPETEMVALALLRAVDLCSRDILPPMVNGEVTNGGIGADTRSLVIERVGEVIGNKIADSGSSLLVRTALEIESPQ